jgi:hypothetical protein
MSESLGLHFYKLVWWYCNLTNGLSLYILSNSSKSRFDNSLKWGTRIKGYNSKGYTLFYFSDFAAIVLIDANRRNLRFEDGGAEQWAVIKMHVYEEDMDYAQSQSSEEGLRLAENFLSM